MASLEESINQAISDLDKIKEAIVSKGIDVPYDTDTSEYGKLIKSIPVGDEEAAFEAGRKAEYDAFWDTFQDYGNRTNYQNAFMQGYPNASYNPKYDLQGDFQGAFALGQITDTKVKMLNCRELTQTFRYNSVITRVAELNVMESTKYGTDNHPFLGATKLSELTMTGVLAKSVIFSHCPLTVASMKSIISCLKDYSGTEYEGTYSITFSSACNNKLDADGNTSPNGNTWREYAADLGWIC